MDFKSKTARQMEKDSQQTYSANFAPILYLENVAAGMDFYTKAFGATEMRHFSNPDGSVHVVEMRIETAMFRLHQEVSRVSEFSPATLKGTSVVLGLLVEDPDGMVVKAIAAGATEIHPVQTYDYGYRQGTVSDPFGHHWQIEKGPLINVLFPGLKI